MFRIVFIVTRSDTIGGSHIHVRDMGTKMMNEGYEVFVMIGGDGPIVNNFKKAGLHVIQIPSLTRNISPSKDFSAFFELKKALRSVHPDIVSTHSSKAGFLGRLASRCLRLPVLFTAHGWSFTTGKSLTRQFFYKTFEKVVAPVTNKIITVSEYDRMLAIEKLSVSSEKVITIHNGMADNDKKFRATFGTDGPVNIVMIARFDRQKDHIELLDATHNIDNIHIHFVGDGPLMKNVKQYAEELGMTGRITFWGRVDAVDEILAKGEIFTLISNWEGFPRSTLEAMRAGMPAIISDVGGASEAVVDGTTGYVIKKGNIAGLHDAVEELVKDSSKRKKMGLAARRRFEENYTFDIMYNKTVAVYREVLEKT